MDNSFQRQPEYGDEISLVDLAATFIRRRRIFYLVFAVVVSVGVAFALITPHKYNYVSLIQLAGDYEGQSLESPVAVIATLQSRWVPELYAENSELNREPFPFKVRFSNPEGTGLISVVSEASIESEALVRSFHDTLLDKVMLRESVLVEREKSSLESRISSLDSMINQMSGSADSAPALTAAVGRKMDLEMRLMGLSSAQILSVGRKSVELVGISKPLIIVLVALLGGLLGVFFAFFADFVVAVRHSISCDTTD